MNLSRLIFRGDGVCVLCLCVHKYNIDDTCKYGRKYGSGNACEKEEIAMFERNSHLFPSNTSGEQYSRVPQKVLNSLPASM